MKNIKFLLAVIISGFIIVSCSFFKEKFSALKEDEKKEDVKETVSEDSPANLDFYNKYIEVTNKISEAVENVNKNYISEVPEPSSVTKNSSIYAISSGVYVTMLETTVKDYKRSFFDNGELAKLNPPNEEMKKAINADFKELLETMEQYRVTAEKVIGYYKNGEYKNDVSKAVPYDKEIKEKYDAYSSAMDKISADLQKFKPVRKRQDPNDYSNPDEKATVILMNSYEDVIEKAENFYSDFEGITKESEVSALENKLDEMQSVFEARSKDVESAEYTDKTKYMKYNYEDYFSKMVKNFSESGHKFLADIKAKKMSQQEFNNGYNSVINNYNNLINSYNTSITTINTVKGYF